MTSPSVFNATGRGFPDVSAVGWEFQYVNNGVVGHVGGTSASSPTFAAVLSVLNSARLAAGKSTLGWVNPFLYKAAAASAVAFHDVVEGNNACGPGCAGCAGQYTCTGFNATKGWDPMTGVGTPNYKELVKIAVEGLPQPHQPQQPQP